MAPDLQVPCSPCSPITVVSMGVATLCALVAIFYWIKQRFVEDVALAMQQMVDKIKECGLNTRGGLIVFDGHSLVIRHIDENLMKDLGKPKCLDDLLPPAIRQRHRELLKRIIDNGEELPDTLNHPLRNVQILDKDQKPMYARLIIGKVHLRSALHSDFFYVVVQPNGSAIRRSMSRTLGSSSFRATSSSPDMSNFPLHVELQNSFYRSVSEPRMESSYDAFAQLPHMLGDRSASNASARTETTAAAIEEERDGEGLDDNAVGEEDSDEFRAVARMYGQDDAARICLGVVPAAARYSRATVLFADIVDFTKHCMERDLGEVGRWMDAVHAAVDGLLRRHAVRKVETRGDCVICVAGTNYAPADDDEDDGDEATGDVLQKEEEEEGNAAHVHMEHVKHGLAPQSTPKSEFAVRSLATGFPGGRRGCSRPSAEGCCHDADPCGACGHGGGGAWRRRGTRRRRDLSGDQATRMLAFGRELCAALRDSCGGAECRVGMATGAVVLTHFAHGGDALPAKYLYGDTVNLAARMEQTGRPGAVQLSESAARQLAAERGGGAAPLRPREVKGKGTVLTALFDCAAGRFDGEPESPGGGGGGGELGGRRPSAEEGHDVAAAAAAAAAWGRLFAPGLRQGGGGGGGLGFSRPRSP